jgi:hypothetical protein
MHSAYRTLLSSFSRTILLYTRVYTLTFIYSNYTHSSARYLPSLCLWSLLRALSSLLSTIRVSRLASNHVVTTINDTSSKTSSPL